MADTAQDVVNRALREFKRYTGDGLPGEPVNAPLPVGDPQSGVHNPKKKDLRSALLAPVEQGVEEISAIKDEAVAAREGAEDARDLAAQYASDAAAQANVPIYETIAGMGALAVPDGTDRVYVSGLSTVGDGLGGMFVDTDNGTPVAFTSATGEGATARDWYWVYQTKFRKMFEEFGAVGDFDPETRTGTDNSAAWAAALAWSNQHRLPVYGSGNYYIGQAPGEVVDALLHNVPEVDYEFCHFEGVEGEECVLYANRSTTPERPGTTVSRPILKAARPDRTGTFILKNVLLDGGIRGNADLGGTLGSGAFPNVASLLEVRGYEKVTLDNVRYRHFAQNWDTRTPENGNAWRRGPQLIWNNKRVWARTGLYAPTFREGMNFGDNEFCYVRPFYRGNATADGTEGNVSTPLNIVSAGASHTYGRLLHIDDPDFTGAWGGSAINFYVRGDVLIDGKGRSIRGLNDGLNTATGSPSNAAGGVSNKGIDGGAEVASGKTDSVTIRDLTVDLAFQYSLLFNRDDGDEIRQLNLENVVTPRAWRGLITRNVFEINGSIKGSAIQFNPGDNRMGVLATLSGVRAGNFRVVGDGSQTFDYEAPNLDTPIAAGTKVSRRAVEIEKSFPAFRVELYAFDWYYGDVHYLVPVSADEGKGYGANLSIHGSRSTYPTPADSGVAVRFGGTFVLDSVYVDPLSTYNGAPLVQSPFLVLPSAPPITGIQSMQLGNPGTTIAQDALLGRYGFYNGDGSSSQQGERAAVEGRAADASGRGAYLSFLTASVAGALTEHLRLLDVGIPDYADDTAAASGGVPVKGLYRTGSTLKVRVA